MCESFHLILLSSCSLYLPEIWTIKSKFKSKYNNKKYAKAANKKTWDQSKLIGIEKP